LIRANLKAISSKFKLSPEVQAKLVRIDRSTVGRMLGITGIGFTASEADCQGDKAGKKHIFRDLHKKLLVLHPLRNAAGRIIRI
jgi:hypothetical protein